MMDEPETLDEGHSDRSDHVRYWDEWNRAWRVRDTKDEFMQYGSKLWGTISHGASAVSVTDAAQAFARGNLKFNAKLMDADHNGMISEDEFMAYGARKFDHMKGKDGMMSVADASKNFARGNRHPDSP